MNEGFALALSLDGRSKDFVLGVEMGRLWEQLRDPEPFEETIHGENVEIVLRMCLSLAREMQIEDADGPHGEWCHLIVAEAVATERGTDD